MAVGARLSFRERLQPLVRLMVAHQPQPPRPPSMKHDKRGERKNGWESVSSCQWLRAFCSGVDVGMDGGINMLHANSFLITDQTFRFPPKKSISCKEEACHTVNKKNAQIFNHRSIVLHGPTVHKTQLLGPDEAPSCQWTHQTQLKSFLY